MTLAKQTRYSNSTNSQSNRANAYTINISILLKRANQSTCIQQLLSSYLCAEAVTVGCNSCVDKCTLSVTSALATSDDDWLVFDCSNLAESVCDKT